MDRQRTVGLGPGMVSCAMSTARLPRSETRTGGPTVAASTDCSGGGAEVGAYVGVCACAKSCA